MVLKSLLEESYLRQQLQVSELKYSIVRQKNSLYNSDNNFVEVITGIRRCGKSILLKQLINNYQSIAYVNFEDPRLFGFEVADFSKLDEIMGNPDAYFFDEIQNINSWELFVRNLHDRGKKVFIAGSNASLLSAELGTRLTGRHLRKELFPFSYTEYLDFTKTENTLENFSKYFSLGGFPEYITLQNPEVVHNLLKDIVFRDIAIRHSIRNTQVLMDLTLYLLSNVGKEVSYNNLKNTLGFGSTNSVTDYVSWLEDAYLLQILHKFSWSAKKTLINPKKIYGIDNGLVAANTLSFTSDQGRMLENMIFIHLKKNYEKVFYFKEKKECDFVVFNNQKCTFALQVCYEVTIDNQKREVEGLVEALDFFDLPKGFIITYNQKDTLFFKSKTIELLPAFQFLFDKTYQSP